MDSAPLLEIIRQMMLLLFMPGDTVELRVPKAGKYKTISGYYRDHEKLAEAARTNDGLGPGVYWTLNPVLPDLIARRANRTECYVSETTTDAQIVCRRWILVDCDPKRPSGISSTDAEHDDALERARQVRARLAHENWPMPVLIDSGNGAHLLYSCELPNDEASTDLLRRVLNALGARHNDEHVEIDQTTFNAARICKVPGTVARKGDNLPDRPHRVSRVLDVPGFITPVSRQLLEKLAAEASDIGTKRAGRAKPRSAETDAPAHQFDVDSWIEKVGIELVKRRVAYEGGHKWVVRCPLNPEHDNAAIFQTAEGILGFHCFHNSCADYDWHALRARVEPGYRQFDPERDAANPTDVGNAERFVARHGANIRYCHPWRTWLIWDESRWRTDEIGQIEQLAKDTVSAMFAEATKLPEDARNALRKHAMKSEHEQRIKAMIALARSEPGVPIRPSQLDRHPFLLNVENGTLNLETGVLQEHRREDLITKLAPVAYNPDAKARRFMRFMVQIMRGRRALVRYIQRALGYALTGSTREQVFFVLHGTGANGKSTLLNLFHKMLGPDYTKTTPADTFAAKASGEGIPNDLAQLKGARFVTAAEVEGGRFDEAKIKRMTGEDPITARFMRAEWFQYLAQFKIFFACNVKPKIESAGYAMWRRIRLIVFDVQFDNPDQSLSQKLERELPGILAWCVRGCLAWQKYGLGSPDTVVTATAAYKQEMDDIGRFLADCTVQTLNGRVQAKDLYSAYSEWCGRAGETPATHQMFGRKLKDRDLEKKRGGDGAILYVGIALVPGALNDPNDPNLSPIPPIETLSIGVTGKVVQSERYLFGSENQDTAAEKSGNSPTEWVS
jgi:putative DNA primase/helicase